MRSTAVPLLAALALAACDRPGGSEPVAHGSDAAALPIYKDPSQPVAARVEDLLARMSLDDKLGQMTQPDRRFGEVTPAVLAELRLGSILSGGDSAPEPPTPTGWADVYDQYQQAALSTPLGVPILYGVDAVHGHANVYGATVFPHNLGLGATRDPELVERVGRAAAEEIAATGLDWTFAPCLAVSRDDHWGRVYESFGELPALPSAMTTIVTGLQGATLGGTPTSILATAKHYIGDGGTVGGDDQGDTVGSEADLRALHLPPFQAAIARGVGAMMVSYSSWNGARLHGHRYLITDVLKGELGFSGIVMTDWDGIEKLDGSYGFSAEDVRLGANAGVDVFMITEQYRRFIQLLRTEVQEGRVPMARIDDAVRRILRKKFELGLFEHPYADRSGMAELGGAAHRAIAREAVQKSMVVLKNEGGVLPIARDAPKIFVAGKSADNIGYQSGGWTITWQGGSGAITPGTSILAAIRNTVGAGTQVDFSATGDGVDGSYAVAIAVIGETPYAEYEGDREDDLRLDAADQAVVAKLAAAGVPVVTVLVSGRPLDVSAEVAGWAGFVAAWLPGTEGQGVADVLFGVVAPTGKLPITWPVHASQEPINDGDGKVPLYAFGFGLTYDAVPGPWPDGGGGGGGGGEGRDARSEIRAESYSAQAGTQVEPCSEPGCGKNVGWIAPGDWLAYDDVDFGAASPGTFAVRIASGGGSGTVQVRLGAVDGPVVASVPVSGTGGWTAWVTKKVSLAGVAEGMHRVVLTFAGPGGDFVNVNWFRFE